MNRQATSNNPLDRARAYLQKVPGAIQGAGGDEATYRVACVLVNDFALPEWDALQLMMEWNRSCVPPWAEAELRAKMKSALRCAHPKSRGNKLDAMTHRPITPPPMTAERKPDRRGFGPGNRDQLQQLAQLRGIGREGLLWAQQRGVLVFGDWHDHEVYGVTDSSGRILELRRLDGKPFPAFGNLTERKSHAVAGSCKSWPVGILEAKNFPCIALVEGMPDFLAAHWFAVWEQSSHYDKADVRCAPVAMLSATPSIHPDALPHFKGKHVRIFPHADAGGAGLRGAAKWEQQLKAAGVRCEIFDMSRLCHMTGGFVKDINDLLVLDDPRLYIKHPYLFKIMPDKSYAGN